MRHTRCHTTLAMMIFMPSLVLAGCASSPAASGYENPGGKKSSPRFHREHAMQAVWRGRPYHSLLEKFGPPRTIMTHPGHRPGRVDIVIYGVRDATSNCIDAFTVVAPSSSQEPFVIDYFCR